MKGVPTQRDAVRIALEQRGEKIVPDARVTSYTKYTRTWKVARMPDGSLRPTGTSHTFFFLPKRSAFLRVGATSTGSMALKRMFLDILIMEGRAHAKTQAS